MKLKLSLPPLREVPEYAAALQKLSEMNAAAAQINARLEQIGTQLAPSSQPSDALSLSDQIMAGAPARGGRLDLDSLQDERRRLQEHLIILSEGAKLQALAIERLGAALSRKACMTVKGVHRDLARAAAAALRRFDDVQDQEAQFFGQLEALGYEPGTSMQGIAWHLIGTCRTLPEQSQLSMRLKELEAYAGPVADSSEVRDTLPSRTRSVALQA
jgi:hypothetical protein